jgi:hypothetical protein
MRGGYEPPRLAEFSGRNCRAGLLLRQSQSYRARRRAGLLTEAWETSPAVAAHPPASKVRIRARSIFRRTVGGIAVGG